MCEYCGCQEIAAIGELTREHDAVVAEQKAAPSRAAEVAAIERQLLDLYADPALDEKPALLEQRGGAYYSEAAVNLVASLVADRGDVQVVDGEPPDLGVLRPEPVGAGHGGRVGQRTGDVLPEVVGVRSLLGQGHRQRPPGQPV